MMLPPPPDGKIRISYSRADTYLNCPRMYELHYVKNYRRVGHSYPLLLGDLVHRLRDFYITGRLTPEFIERLPEWVAKEFPTYDDALELAYEAFSLFHTFVRKDEEVPLEWVSSETHLELDCGKYTLYTRLDALARTVDGRLWREELKTTARMDNLYINGLKGGLQAGIAFKVLKEVMPEKVNGTIYDILVKTKIPRCERSPIPMEKTLEKMTIECVEGVVDGILNKRFHPSMKCNFYNRECDYLPICRGTTQNVIDNFFIIEQDGEVEEDGKKGGSDGKYEYIESKPKGKNRKNK